MNTKSYVGKTFVATNSDARVRDPQDLTKFLRYKAGDNIPPGKHVGDFITIPVMSEIHVTDVRTDPDRKVFVFAEPASGNGAPFGWTNSVNLEGEFLNETTGSSPAEFVLPPQGNNMTVVDAAALIRQGPPSFHSTGTSIPRGTFVVVTQTLDSANGQMARISRARLETGQIVTEGEIGFTKSLNLAAGWSDEYNAAAFSDQKGPNAAWRRGEFIGQKVLVRMVGLRSQLENVTLAGLESYMPLREKLAQEANITLSIESSFRTFAAQVELFRIFQHGGNTAAEPGRSNHQHGQAFDLNTAHAGFDNDPVYRALREHGPSVGFIRTVSGEPWHWEFLPDKAAEHGFKMPGVDP